jgi:hypothetical protein
MGIGALAWVSLFFRAEPGGAHEANHVSTMGWFVSFATEVQLYPVAPFSRLSERAVLGLLLSFACVALMAHLGKRSLRPAPVTLLAASGACFLLFLVAPERINGSFYFAERFPILWVLFLLVGTAAIRGPRGWNVAAGGLAVLVTLVVLFQQRINVRRIASEIAVEQKLPAAPPGSVGMIVSPTRFVPYGLGFNPYMWCGVEYFRRSHAILANDPWMELPLIMLEPTHPNRWSFHDPDAEFGPFVISAAEGTAARDLDFVVQMGSSDFEIDRLLHLSGWTIPGGSDLLQIYRRP